jgi:hypothetical protein
MLLENSIPRALTPSWGGTYFLIIIVFFFSGLNIPGISILGLRATESKYST